ncbi:MAG TPA: V-type ATP synthase subunit F [Firmicutes bacterium]|nr:V-type ATP synthase subunit F [Bacillota bacterium]
MSMPSLAVIGNRDSVLAFKSVGFVTYPAETREQALAALADAKKQGCAVIYITEKLALALNPELKDLTERTGITVAVIPDNRQRLGIGLKRMKEYVEKAIGVDILFREEGREHETR